MKEDAYVAGQIERAVQGDPRTHELGVRVKADGDDVVLRGQVASEERRQLVAGQPPSAIRGLDQRAEQILTRIRLRAVELPVQVLFQHNALLELAAGHLEDMDAPADPGVGLRLGNIQQVSQRA